jgi:hypothetical protein
MIPYHSHDVPKHNHQLPKADFRSETTAFQLLIWTYADERVRAASEEWDGDTFGPFISRSTPLGRLVDGVMGSGRGTINGQLYAHEDALQVDALVAAWCEHRSDEHHYLAWHFEKRMAPPHPSTLEPERKVPRLRPNGKPHMLYDHNRHPIGVVHDLVGHSPKQIAFADRMIRLFDGLLDLLMRENLKKWRVLERGLTVCAK